MASRRLGTLGDDSMTLRRSVSDIASDSPSAQDTYNSARVPWLALSRRDLT